MKTSSAKSKGSQFEYDCQYSLSKLYPEIWRTSERGFQLQYDLEDRYNVYECKRLKSMSWNQAKKFFIKLDRECPKDEDGDKKFPFLLFKSNRQPCLVMYFDGDMSIAVKEFGEFFGVPFEKHPSTRKKK